MRLLAQPFQRQRQRRDHCLSLVSLNNRSSRAGAPNENYARELFELHTLGRQAYLNAVYDRWRQVPGAEKGHPAGYIDQDVYEAARAFTGWTLEDGSNTGMAGPLPKTGKFTYVDAWHDQYQKRVMAVEFDPYQSPMNDGRKVLDIVATHPATAAHLVEKLSLRLGLGPLGDATFKAAVALWQRTTSAPDQIAQVVRYLVLNGNFAGPPRLRRPLELALAYIRASGLVITPSEGLLNELSAGGQALFGWPTPDGLPDDDAYWLGVNALRRRWSLIAGLTDNAWGNGRLKVIDNEGQDPALLLAQWSVYLHGETRPGLIDDILHIARLPAGKPLKDEAMARRLVAMAPEFQIRGEA